MDARLYADRLGLSLEPSGRVLLPFQAALSNTGGALHGGAIVSLGLHAATSAAGGDAVLAGFAASFLAPAREEAISACPAVAAAGRRTKQMDIPILGDRGQAVARVAATVVSGDDRKPGHYAAPASISLPGGVAGALPGAAARTDHDLARRSPYTALLGASGLCSAGGVGAMTVPIDGNRTDHGAIDAGALAGGLDTCAALASRSLEPNREPLRAATVTMALAFEPLPAADLSLRARVVIRRGSSVISHVEATVAGEDAVVASGTVTYRFHYEN